METIPAHIYDFPKYYDLLFGADWRAEFDFLKACFRQHALRPVHRPFEPACGTGRLLAKFAKAGYEVSGNDLNAKAVEFCNARLVRQGFAPTAVVGDMTDFRLRRRVDAAFNTINSFRHLGSERTAEDHLRCVHKNHPTNPPASATCSILQIQATFQRQGITSQQRASPDRFPSCLREEKGAGHASG